MLKMIFTLSAALYAGFVIWGAPEISAAETRDVDAPVILAATGDFSRPTILGAAGAEPATVTRTAVATEVTLPAPAAIAASAPVPSAIQPRLIGEPVVVSLVQPAPATAIIQEEPEQILLRVTGNRVNMRSGPSVSNGIVASLVRDTLAEPLGEEVNGWLEIRDLATGRTGFMSARFLEPS